MIHVAASQNSLGINQSREGKALSRFNSGEYAAVIHLLGSAPSALNERYLVEMSKISLGTGMPAKLQQEVVQNPKHYLNSLANFAIGKYHFYKDNFPLSDRSLKAIDASDLTEKDREKYYFMRGYIFMQNKQYNNARNYFQRAATLTQENNTELTYYQGFIAYHLDNKEMAQQFLTKVIDDAQFGASARFFIAKIQLEKEEYEEVVALAQSELSEDRSITNSEFNQLIGEAFALQNEANKAANYFDKAIELHPSKPSAALYYQAGVANFKIDLKKKAIEYLTEAGLRSGEYAHLSAFQLGRLYVSSDEKAKATAAYVEASASSDPEIRQESLFKAGKLLLDQGNHAEGINYLEDYRREFKQAKWTNESENLLAQAYLRTSNYDQAITHLKEIGITSVANRSIYQKVTFQKALLLFKDQQYLESVQWFNESLLYPQDLSLKDDAYFNQAEAHFNLSNYSQAIESYTSMSNPSTESLYGTGYAYFNLFRYSECIPFFEQLMSSSISREIRADSELRLADAYYTTKAYDKALEYYNRIFARNKSSYVTYQIGIVNRNLDRKSDAISSFERLLQMPEDSLTDDAIFQIAQLEFESADFSKSEFHFSSLISKYPTSNMIPEAYLNRAISRTNLNKLDESKSDFQFIGKNLIHSKVAFNAILGLQELQTRGVEVGNIQQLIEKYKSANPDAESLEVIEFEFAKSQYFNLEYEKSTAAFKKFVDDYPNSTYQIEAQYYLGDAYYRQNELEAARTYFEKISALKGVFIGRVYARLGEINFELKDYEKAVSSYTSLLGLDLSPKDNYNGRAGLMKTYYANENYEKCLETADEIINSDWKPLNAERGAILVKGRSYLAMQNSELAEKSLESITSETDRISAEASFLLAKLKSEQADYETSLELLFGFNSKYGSYQDLIDQSYLQIATNYIQMDELFQAKATLRSIVQHSENEEIKTEALRQLTLIENQTVEDSTSNKQ